MENYSRMLSTGLVLKSATGRELSAAPRIDCTSDRKTLNSMKRVHFWLKEEALQECVHVGNEHAEIMVKSVDLTNLTNADVDMMNMILFDVDFAGLSKRLL